MNRKQIIAVITAVLAVIVVFKIPPYYDSRDFFEGTAYFPIAHSPADNLYIGPDVWMLKVEFSFVALSLATALIALRRRAPRRQRTALYVGICLEATIFAVNVRSFNMILQPEFTFYFLNLVAVVILIVVILRGCGPNPNTDPDPQKYPV